MVYPLAAAAWLLWSPARAWKVFRGSYGSSKAEHWRFGYEMGQTYAAAIRERRPLWRGTEEELRRVFDETFYEERYPLYLEELRGVAAGSGVDEFSIFKLNMQEETRAAPAKADGCSDYTAPPVVGHNEDNRASEKNKTFLAEVAFDGEWFSALTYAGELPTAGFGWNAHVAFTTDYVEPRDFLFAGVGRLWVARHMLTATSLDEALEIARTPHVAGHNYQVFNKTHFFAGEVARDLSIFRPVSAPLFKANEYDWLDIPQNIGESTVHRTARARAQLPTPTTARQVLDVLWDDHDVDQTGRLGIYCDTCTLCTVLFDGPRLTIYEDKRAVYARADWARRLDWIRPSSSSSSGQQPRLVSSLGRLHQSNGTSLASFFASLAARLRHLPQWFFACLWFLLCLALILCSRNCGRAAAVPPPQQDDAP